MESVSATSGSDEPSTDTGKGNRKGEDDKGNGSASSVSREETVIKKKKNNSQQESFLCEKLESLAIPTSQLCLRSLNTSPLSSLVR